MRNKKQRNYRAKNTSPDKKAKCNEDQRNYRAFSLSMECTITKFLQVVNQGQLYSMSVYVGTSNAINVV